MTCADADIEGSVKGIIRVDALTILRENARIEGEITTTKLQVEDGAQFSGNCKMSNFVAGPKAPAPSPGMQEDLVY